MIEKVPNEHDEKNRLLNTDDNVYDEENLDLAE